MVVRRSAIHDTQSFRIVWQFEVWRHPSQWQDMPPEVSCAVEKEYQLQSKSATWTQFEYTLPGNKNLLTFYIREMKQHSKTNDINRRIRRTLVSHDDSP